MRQLSLQGFPDGAIRIGSFLSVLKKDGRITYFLGNDNFYSHPESDRAGQRFAIATLMANGHVRPRDVACSALGIPRRTLANWTSQLAERGPGSFFEARATRGRTVITAEKAAECGRLLDEIVPELLESVPGQPSEAELANDPLLHRFAVIFDREGSSHSLISKLWEKRIGAVTYRKAVKDVWPESEFSKVEVPVPGGGATDMKLASRQTELKAGKASIPVLEVRRLSKTGHQTAIATTAQRLQSPVIAGRMFSRWCQENFFGYMMEHFDIDGLVQYGAEEIPGATQVVNPAWRSLDKSVRVNLGRIRKLQAELGSQMLRNEGRNIQISAELLDDIQTLESETEQLRRERRQTARKVKIESLPLDQRPSQLRPLGKMLADTVKMIAYRAETALVGLLRPHLSKEEEARALIRELFVSSADLEPDEKENTLTVRIHRMACPAHDKAVGALLDDLTAEAFLHPETGMRMIYKLA